MLTSHISGSELLENVVLLFNECKKKRFFDSKNMQGIINYIFFLNLPRSPARDT